MNKIFALILLVLPLTLLSLPTDKYGQYVTVPQGKIYTQSYGNKGPTVIFIAGTGGEGVYDWRYVAPEVAKYARVLTYDRIDVTGKNNPEDHGRSIIKKTYQTKPLTGSEMTQNIQILLHHFKLKPPYVVVGHSYGGIIAEYFARQYPKQIKSVVMVDATSVRTLLELQKKRHGKMLDLPPKDVDYYPEALGMPATVAQLQKLAKFPNVPLVVLGAMYHYQPKAKQAERLKQSMLSQQSIANLSPQHQLVWADTGHFIEIQMPWLVTASIKQAIDVKHFTGCKQWSTWNPKACEWIKSGKISPDADFSAPLSIK